MPVTFSVLELNDQVSPTSNIGSPVQQPVPSPGDSAAASSNAPSGKPPAPLMPAQPNLFSQQTKPIRDDHGSIPAQRAVKQKLTTNNKHEPTSKGSDSFRDQVRPTTQPVQHWHRIFREPKRQSALNRTNTTQNQKHSHGAPSRIEVGQKSAKGTNPARKWKALKLRIVISSTQTLLRLAGDIITQTDHFYLSIVSEAEAHGELENQRK